MIKPLHDLCCVNDNVQFKNDKDVIINVPKRDDPQVVAVLAMAVINFHVTHQIKRELGIPKLQPTEY